MIKEEIIRTIEARSESDTKEINQLKNQLKEKHAILDEYETKLLELMIELDELRHNKN